MENLLSRHFRRNGGEGTRTPDLRLAKPALCQTELRPRPIFQIPNSNANGSIGWLMGLSRFELLTSRLSGVRSNQLSYRPSIHFCRKIKPLGL